MTREYKDKLTIRVQRSQPYMALQEYTRQVLEAGRQGWEVTEMMVDHARLSGAADFSITLGMGVANGESGQEDWVEQAQAGVESEQVIPKLIKDAEDMWDKIDSEEVLKPEEVVQEMVPVDLDELKTKKDLLSYAKGLDIIIPKEHRSVISIRKYLKEV